MASKKQLALLDDRAYQVTLPPADRSVTLPPGLPELTLGYVALTWIEQNLVVASGPLAGKPFKATFDQALFLLWYYAVDANGTWVYARAVRRLAKGSGKTPFAAAIALFELLGPCRVDFFSSRVPGGVVGRPVSMPLVQIAATSEDQTGVTMRQIWGLAHKRTAVAKKYELEVGKTYLATPTGGKLQLLTSSAPSAEGGESSFVIADEVEHWVPRNGGVELWETLKRNLNKTGSRMLETCNAWAPGADSVAERSFEDWSLEQEGRTVDRGVLYDARVAPANTVLTDTPGEDEFSVTEGLQFVYKHSPWVPIDAIKRGIWTPSAQPSVSRRFYLNQPTVAEDAWVTPEQWSALADTSREVMDGEDVVLFFDGSKSNDHTALVGCCMSDGHVFTVGVWEPDEFTNVIDAGRVDSVVRSMRDKYNVVAFFSDVREWESFAKVSWPEYFGDSLLVPAQREGKAKALIAWDMRSHAYDFALAAELCKAEIEEASFSHDGNWITARHIANARMSESRGHVSIKKESPKSAKKIDAAVCVIGARMVYRKVLESNEWSSRVSSGADWVVF